MEGRILVHGHRGARAVRPENTLPAFSYALEAGVDVLELDLTLTSDDAVVVSHDSEMNPAYCQGPAEAPRRIRAMTLEQLRQWDCGALVNPKFPRQQAVPGTRVPTLAEVFELAAGRNVGFNIETKMPEGAGAGSIEPRRFVELILAEVRRFHLEQRVILQSFDYRTLAVARELAPALRRSALFPTGTFDRDLDYVTVARQAGAGIVSPLVATVTPGKVAAAHEAGLEIVPWTANTPAEWDRLIAAGADAIITDDPAALIAYLAARGLR